MLRTHASMLAIIARQKYFDRQRRLRLLPEQVAFPFFRRKRPGEMLQSGEVIDADVVRDRRVLFAVGAGVNQRGSAAPVFVRGIGEENLRHDFLGDGAVEQAAGLSGDRIFLGLIGEWKNIGRKEDRGRGLRVARGLGEAIIETAAARSGNVRQNAVERNASFFVRIEALIEEVAQEAPILRNAFAIDACRGSDGIGCVLGIGREVAYRGEAAAGHDRIGDHVNIFVDFSGLKAAVQVDMAVTRSEFAVDRLRELPFRAGNDGACVPRASRAPSARCADRRARRLDIRTRRYCRG